MASPIHLEGEWLTASQAQQRLGVTASRFFELVRTGRVEFEKLPNGRLYNAEAIAKLRAELDATPWNKPDAPDDGAQEG